MEVAKYTKYIIWLFFFFIAQISPNISSAVDKPNSLIVNIQHDRLNMDAKAVPLGEILEEIYRKAGVNIVGLENRKDEPITFASAGETEEVLRRLLRHLKENNYAFEFSDVKLLKISVVSDSGNRKMASAPVRKNEEPEEQKELVNAIKVQGIVEGTQAASLGFMDGDYIVEYDGMRISHSQQLVNEVKKRSEKDNVEMTVMRDRTPMRFTVKGGLIGVNITTVRVPKEEVGE